METAYQVRDFILTDKNLIASTFLKGVYYGGTLYGKIPKAIFMKNYQQVLDSFLVSPKVRIKVAWIPGEPDIIIGYCIQSRDETAVHWVYVKERWRKMGIAKALVPPSPTVTTHLSKIGLDLMQKFPNMIYNPFYL